MQKIPTKSLIFHRLHVSSIGVYRKFFKNKYNLAYSLELDVFSSSFGNQTRVKQTKRKLLKMARKIKYISGLRLHKCLFYNLALKDIQILRLIKSFPHLKHMSLSFEGASIDVLRTYTKWVSFLKYLTSLAFIFRRYLTQATFADPMIKQTKKFVQMLKKKRLEKLRVLAEANYNALLTPLFEFSNYPASLKKLNFTWNGFGNILSDFSSSNALLTHMKNLTALSIVLPITTDVLQPIIASVPNPHIISTMNLQICHKILENNTVDFFVLKDTFEGYNGLTRISFKLKTWPGQDQSYWKFLTACPLIEWCLDTPVEEADDLVFVSQLAGSLSNLKSLKLKFKAYKPVDFLQKDCFGTFFQHIAKLKNLEQLKIYFIVFYPPKDKTKSVNFVSSLSKCIDQLPKLNQLSIRFRQGDMTQEFGGLFQSLRNKALNLTKLRINFAGQKIQKTDLDILIEAIHQMKFLQVVVLDELHLAFAEYFKGLADALVSVKYPKIIKLTGISGELDITMFANFVREILPKFGFKQLLCTENGLSKINLVEEANRIKLKGIVEKNPELQSAYVPFNIYYNNSEISFWKWS